MLPPNHSPNPTDPVLPPILQTLPSPHQLYTYQQSPSQSYYNQTSQFNYTYKSIPNQSQLNQRENQLVERLYIKERELVVMEHRVQMFRNANLCLRETLQQQKQAKQVIEQHIHQLTQRLKQLTQQLLNKQINNQSQIFPKSSLTKIQQQNLILKYDNNQLKHNNNQLKRQIQQIKFQYQQQIQFLTKNYKQQIQQKIIQSKHQKKRLLQQHLVIIDDMRKEIDVLKSIQTIYGQQSIQLNQSYQQQANQYHNQIDMEQVFRRNCKQKWFQKLVRDILTKQKIKQQIQAKVSSNILYQKINSLNMQKKTDYKSRQYLSPLISRHNSKGNMHSLYKSQILNEKHQKYLIPIYLRWKNYELTKQTQYKYRIQENKQKRQDSIDKKLQEIRRNILKQINTNDSITL